MLWNHHNSTTKVWLISLMWHYIRSGEIRKEGQYPSNVRHKVRSIRKRWHIVELTSTVLLCKICKTRVGDNIAMLLVETREPLFSGIWNIRHIISINKDMVYKTFQTLRIPKYLQRYQRKQNVLWQTRYIGFIINQCTFFNGGCNPC